MLKLDNEGHKVARITARQARRLANLDNRADDLDGLALAVHARRVVHRTVHNKLRTERVRTHVVHNGSHLDNDPISVRERVVALVHNTAKVKLGNVHRSVRVRVHKHRAVALAKLAIHKVGAVVVHRAANNRHHRVRARHANGKRHAARALAERAHKLERDLLANRHILHGNIKRALLRLRIRRVADVHRKRRNRIDSNDGNVGHRRAASANIRARVRKRGRVRHVRVLVPDSLVQQRRVRNHERALAELVRGHNNAHSLVASTVAARHTAVRRRHAARRHELKERAQHVRHVHVVRRAARGARVRNSNRKQNLIGRISADDALANGTGNLAHVQLRLDDLDGLLDTERADRIVEHAANRHRVAGNVLGDIDDNARHVDRNRVSRVRHIVARVHNVAKHKHCRVRNAVAADLVRRRHRITGGQRAGRDRRSNRRNVRAHNRKRTRRHRSVNAHRHVARTLAQHRRHRQ